MCIRIMRWVVRGALGMGLTLTGSACGTWQSATGGTASATRAVFEAKVEQMNLVVPARGALNQDARGASLPVVLRIYQLKDDKPFATATYEQVLEGIDALKGATLWSQDVTVGPG